MKRLLGIVVAVVAVSFASVSSEARADHRSCRSSSRSYGHYSHSYSRPSISVNVGGFGFYSGRSSYGSCYSPSPVWHDTSHYDYHPTQVIPHRNHYHVVPGHYDYHRSGHWHY